MLAIQARQHFARSNQLHLRRLNKNTVQGLRSPCWEEWLFGRDFITESQLAAPIDESITEANTNYCECGRDERVQAWTGTGGLRNL